jgi:hypothetical protein
MGTTGNRTFEGETVTDRERVRVLLLLALIVAALAYSWFSGGFRPFTRPMDAAVALPVLGALVASVRAGGRHQPAAGRSPESDRVGAAIWIGLATLLVSWELFAYFSSPRQDHPTLSSIADTVMSTHPGRSLMFALWLALGWRLFVRTRSEPR